MVTSLWSGQYETSLKESLKKGEKFSSAEPFSLREKVARRAG